MTSDQSENCYKYTINCDLSPYGADYCEELSYGCYGDESCLEDAICYGDQTCKDSVQSRIDDYEQNGSKGRRLLGTSNVLGDLPIVSGIAFYGVNSSNSVYCDHSHLYSFGYDNT